MFLLKLLKVLFVLLLMFIIVFNIYIPSCNDMYISNNPLF